MKIKRIILDIEEKFVSRINEASKIDHRTRNSFLTKSVMDRVEDIEAKEFMKRLKNEDKN